ncbi:hypothetical protein LSH36_166g00031 [Paralvinella palmiformis]|uniref:Uncharacterized protein n=1 Tax=Paralvinella palmiformis TaxID=53620 RepID=A0AAD9JU74_9ANNE|nr:hypothetical protein LSH36_166g00031 [Paralvinella palmiformis]
MIDPDRHLDQVKKWPDEIFLHDFLRMGQFAVADKLISIPLNHFNKLAEEMEDEGAKIILLHNKGLCGGILVTALFKETEFDLGYRGTCFTVYYYLEGKSCDGKRFANSPLSREKAQDAS